MAKQNRFDGGFMQAFAEGMALGAGVDKSMLPRSQRERRETAAAKAQAESIKNTPIDPGVGGIDPAMAAFFGPGGLDLLEQPEPEQAPAPQAPAIFQKLDDLRGELEYMTPEGRAGWNRLQRAREWTIGQRPAAQAEIVKSIEEEEARLNLEAHIKRPPTLEQEMEVRSHTDQDGRVTVMQPEGAPRIDVMDNFAMTRAQIESDDKARKEDREAERKLAQGDRARVVREAKAKEAEEEQTRWTDYRTAALKEKPMGERYYEAEGELIDTAKRRFPGRQINKPSADAVNHHWQKKIRLNYEGSEMARGAFDPFAKPKTEQDEFFELQDDDPEQWELDEDEAWEILRVQRKILADAALGDGGPVPPEVSYGDVLDHMWENSAQMKKKLQREWREEKASEVPGQIETGTPGVTVTPAGGGPVAIPAENMVPPAPPAAAVPTTEPAATAPAAPQESGGPAEARITDQPGAPEPVIRTPVNEWAGLPDYPAAPAEPPPADPSPKVAAFEERARELIGSSRATFNEIIDPATMEYALEHGGDRPRETIAAKLTEAMDEGVLNINIMSPRDRKEHTKSFKIVTNETAAGYEIAGVKPGESFIDGWGEIKKRPVPKKKKPRSTRTDPRAATEAAELAGLDDGDEGVVIKAIKSYLNFAMDKNNPDALSPHELLRLREVAEKDKPARKRKKKPKAKAKRKSPVKQPLTDELRETQTL